jgi:hypothetical protein
VTPTARIEASRVTYTFALIVEFSKRFRVVTDDHRQGISGICYRVPSLGHRGGGDGPPTSLPRYGARLDAGCHAPGRPSGSGNEDGAALNEGQSEGPLVIGGFCFVRGFDTGSSLFVASWGEDLYRVSEPLLQRPVSQVPQADDAGYHRVPSDQPRSCSAKILLR